MEQDELSICEKTYATVFLLDIFVKLPVMTKKRTTGGTVRLFHDIEKRLKRITPSSRFDINSSRKPSNSGLRLFHLLML